MVDTHRDPELPDNTIPELRAKIVTLEMRIRALQYLNSDLLNLINKINGGGSKRG